MIQIIATPIGNLADLSSRAKQALQDAEIVLCEDTRRAKQLFQAIGLSYSTKSIERVDAYAKGSAISHWVALAKEGRLIAFISDAGTPGVSDPGAALVQEARRQSVPVSPVPGASAVTALISVSGAKKAAFSFRGFFPRKSSEQLHELEEIKRHRSGEWVIWFESPVRILKALDLISKQLPEADVLAAKEITKVHEKFFYGSSGEVFLTIQNHLNEVGERGEWCFGIYLESENKNEVAALEEWVSALKCLLIAGIRPADAAKIIGQYFGVKKNQVYALAHELSLKK